MSNYLNLSQSAQLIKNWDNILILCHKSPDGDTLGSGYGLKAVLNKLGISSRVECFDKAPEKYDYFTQVLPNKEFTPEYIISVDVADAALLGDGICDYPVDLAIDHHISHRDFAKNTLLDATAAATTQIIYDLAKELAVEIDSHIADCLYTGTTTDTGCFKYSNTTSKTMRMAAELMEAGADFVTINKVMFDTKNRNRLALEREVLDRMEYHFDNKIALVCLSVEVIASTGADENDFEGISPIPRQIEGVEAGIIVREKPNGIKISFRTNTVLDASEICGKLGGGGHKRASGALIKENMEVARQMVLDTIAQYEDVLASI